MSDRGPWIQTFSGKLFFPLDPRPEEICIEDIAHALANQCRFGGHVSTFFSVAQHSLLVSEICDRCDALAGLLHDAAEAYVGDCVRPIKRLDSMRSYRNAEQHILEVILEKYGLDRRLPGSVHIADEIMLATEARDLMMPNCDMLSLDDWCLHEKPHEKLVIRPWQPPNAEYLFLERFAELTRKRAA